MNFRGGRANIAWHTLAAALLLALVLGTTWPLARKAATHVAPGEISIRMVSNLNLWTLAWNYSWLEGQNADYWKANIFYPHDWTFAYSEPQFGTALLSYPVFLGTRNEVAAYNTAILIFLWSAGMIVYGFLWSVLPRSAEGRNGNRWLASLVPAIAYSLNPYVFREIGVLQLLAIPFLPLTLWGLHRFVESGRWRDGVLAAFGFVATWYTCAYYGLFLVVFIVLFPFFYFRKELLTRGFILKSLVVFFIVVVALVPLLIGMTNAKSAMGLTRPKGLVQALSAELAGYVIPPGNSMFWSALLGFTHTRISHNIGYLLYALSATGALATWRLGIIGPGSNRHGSVAHASLIVRPLCAPIRYWLGMAILSFLLSLGMAFAPTSPDGLGVFSVFYWVSPYNLLYEFFPGFSSIRSAYRFSIFLALFAAPLAGLGLWWLSQLRFRVAGILPAGAFLLLLVDIWPGPLRLVHVPRGSDRPALYEALSNRVDRSALLELPMAGLQPGKLEDDSTYMLHSTAHWQPLINGYSGFAPQAYHDLTRVISVGPIEQVIAALSAFNVKRVLIHWSKLTPPERKRMRLLSELALSPVSPEGPAQLYRFADSHCSTNRSPLRVSFQVYESAESSDRVTVALHYQGTSSLLTTPWKDPIKVRVSWFRSLEDLQQIQKNALVVTDYSHPGSRLLQNGTTIRFDQPTPPPGSYWMTMEGGLPNHTAAFTAKCTLGRSGFVEFNPLPQ